MSVDGFTETAYAAYKSFMEAFVKDDEQWKIKIDENVAVVLIGQKGDIMSLDEYKSRAGSVIAKAMVHVDFVDGFKRNRSLNTVAVDRFKLSFQTRGILRRESLLGCLLQDNQLVNESKVTVVERSGVFKDGIEGFSFTVIGGNHRISALKQFGDDFLPGSEADLEWWLVPEYVRGQEYTRLIEFDIIAVPPSVHALCFFAANDNMKSQVCVLHVICFVVIINISFYGM